MNEYRVTPPLASSPAFMILLSQKQNKSTSAEAGIPGRDLSIHS